MSRSKSFQQIRAARIAMVANTLRMRARAEKLHAHQQATQAHNQAAYLLAVQQLAAQYGVAAPTTLSVRSVPTAQKHAPSAAPGACARVHAIATECNGDRSATLARCKAEGINPATAQTQYAKWKKANVQ